MRSFRHTLLILAALAACRDASGPEGGLVVSAGTTEMLEGRTTPLSVTLDGQPVDPADVQWLSRNPFTVDVVGSTAHARLPGVTWLVATAYGLTDSVRVGVRFTGLGINRVGVLITGEGEIEQRFTLGGVSLLNDLPNARTSTTVHATSGPRNPADPDIFAGDTILSIRLQGTPQLGLRTLPPFVAEEQPDGGFRFYGSEGLVMILHQPYSQETVPPTETSTTFFVAVNDSPIEFTTIDVPAEAGVDHGTLAGRMSFEAAGFRIVYPQSPAQPYVEQTSANTVRIYVEFSTDFYRVPIPSAGFSLQGTPYSGSTSGGGLARLRDGALEIYQDALVNFREPDERYVELTLSLAAPALGEFDLSTAAAVLRASFSVFVRGHPDGNSGQMELESTAVATGGTVTITEYRAPTDRAYGVVAGTYTATLDFGAAHPDYSTTVQSTFRIPIDPLLGVPTDMTR